MEEIEFRAPTPERVELRSVLFRFFRAKITHRVLVGATVLIFLARSTPEDVYHPINLETQSGIIEFTHNGRTLYAEKVEGAIIIFGNVEDADLDITPVGEVGEGDDIRNPEIYRSRLESLKRQHPGFVAGEENTTLARQ